MRKESSHWATVEQKLLSGTDFKCRKAQWTLPFAGFEESPWLGVDQPLILVWIHSWAWELQALLSEEPVGWFCLGALSGSCGVCCSRAVLLSGRGRIEKSIFGTGDLPDTPLPCACLFCSEPPSTNTPNSEALRVGGRKAGEHAGNEHTWSDGREVETFLS